MESLLSERSNETLENTLDSSDGDSSSIQTPLDESEQEASSSEDEQSVNFTPAQQKAYAAKKRARRKQKSNQVRSSDPDIEDLGVAMPALTTAKVEQQANLETSTARLDIGSIKSLDSNKKEMISSMTRKALTKQGYGLIGSHSGVKTCRWTKAALRGRGFCYKHVSYVYASSGVVLIRNLRQTFYG